MSDAIGIPDLTPEFIEFPKIARLNREVVVTEKLDGTNAQVVITEDGDMFFGSRTKWITPTDDNYGFARWGTGNKMELIKLGPGKHFGEWWGQGIQRGYGLKEKRFSLFNSSRWAPADFNAKPYSSGVASVNGVRIQDMAPECCYVVPELYRGKFSTDNVSYILKHLENFGSRAAPGFINPEGIVVFHTAGHVAFKATIKKDEEPKTFNKK